MRAASIAMLIVAALMYPGASAHARAVLVQSGAFADASGPVEHMATLARLQAHVASMRRAGVIAPASRMAATPVTSAADLTWPLERAPGFNPYDYHGTSWFVDHDPRFPGFVEDYTCGTRTYDLANGYNHAGTDYYLWPFAWLMMDQADVRIIAAAPGVIIEKDDGNFDRNCAIDASGNFNAVFVQQDDGLIAWYLHMKSGSLTPAPVGSRVATGDYLGLVGSSGASSAPHLHFELTDAAGNVVDPLHGACSAAPDRWIVAQPYEAPRIDTLTTHSAEPQAPACGVDEQPNYKDQFMPGDTLWAFASWSDQRAGEVSHFSIARPDGSVFAQWDFDLASENLPRPFYSGSAMDWPFTLPADSPAGAWTLNASFEGSTYQHVFQVGAGLDPDRGGLTGSWANPRTLGQGVEMDVEQDFYGNGVGLLFAGWFTFDANAAGGQRWYTLQGEVKQGVPTTTLPIYSSDGGAFESPQASQTSVVGQATLNFADCTHATLSYEFSGANGRSGSMPLTRQLADVDCGQPRGTPIANSSYLLSGGWADPAMSGQGILFDRNPTQNVLFAAWYTYAADASPSAGESGQRWYTLQAIPGADPSHVDNIGIYATSAGIFDSTAGVATVSLGTANLVYHSCSQATLNWQFSAGENSGLSGSMNLVRLGTTPAACHL